MEILLLVLLAGALGATLASFCQCAVTRTAQGKSWVRGRSVCDNCGRQLTWYENIPIVSYVIQKGKSRCCNQRLSPVYLWSELLAALLAASIAAKLLL